MDPLLEETDSAECEVATRCNLIIRLGDIELHGFIIEFTMGIVHGLADQFPIDIIIHDRAAADI
jgi:hypothetical protein